MFRIISNQLSLSDARALGVVISFLLHVIF